MSKYLFYISSFLSAFPIAALNFNGFALYYLLPFIFLDSKILTMIIRDLFIIKKNKYSLIFFSILVIYALFHSFINLEFFEFTILFFKSFIFLYLILYFYYAFSAGYSLIGFYIGLAIFIIFQFIQLIEYSFINDVNNLYSNLHNWTFLKTPVGDLLFLQGNTHVNFSKDGFPFFINYFGDLFNIKNVSSFAAEPSIAAFFLLPMIFIFKNKFIKFVLVISLFVTFSKTAYFTILFLFIIFIFNKIIKININGFFLIFGITFFILFYSFYFFNYTFNEKYKNCMTGENYTSEECFYRIIDQSMSNRLLPAILYIENTNVYEKIFGVGFMQSKNVFIDSKWSPNDFKSQMNLKNIYGGFIGILLELGLIGLLIYSISIFYFLKNTNYHIASYTLIIYGLSYFYLTLFPFFMFFIAKLIYDERVND